MCCWTEQVTQLLNLRTTTYVENKLDNIFRQAQVASDSTEEKNLCTWSEKDVLNKNTVEHFWKLQLFRNSIWEQPNSTDDKISTIDQSYTSEANRKDLKY
jgi:hypothetical protein